MTVKELRRKISKFYELIACNHLFMLRRQKIGFNFKQVFNKKEQILTCVVADAILEANEPLLEKDSIRLPIWISENTFESFISKIS